MGTALAPSRQAIGQSVHLPHAIASGNRREHRFHVAAAEKLDLPALYHHAQPLHVIGIMGEELFEQPAAEMDRKAKRRIASESVDERLVATRMRVVHDTLEIA